MKRILSFEDYSNRANEADLFGVTTSSMGNLPTGYDDSDSEEVEDTRGIDPSKHALKLIATDYSDFAVLGDKNGKKYIFYIDTQSPNFDSDYKIYDEFSGDYLDLDDLGVEAAANDVPEMEIGFGADDWTKGEKSLVELDEELADDLVEDFKSIVNKGADPKYRRDTQNVMDVLKEIAEDLKSSNESVDYEESETDGKPGDEESETDETTEVMESEGIHPAIREKLMGYLKDNKDATYAEAKKHIAEKIAGWKLSEEDFEEAKKII